MHKLRILSLRNLCFITFFFLSLASQAQAQGSYVIIHAHNPEGIEIAAIEGVNANSVEFYADDKLIGYGAYNAETHNKPIPISPGTHLIKVKFNGMVKEQTFAIEPNETKIAVFTFERTNLIDEIKEKLPMSFTDNVAISAWTNKSDRVWKETDSYDVGGDFFVNSCSADVSITVQEIITLSENNRVHMESHILGGTSLVWDKQSTSWSAGATGFMLINKKNAITLSPICNIWFVQGWGVMPTQGGIYLHNEQGEQSAGPIGSYIADITGCRHYLYGLLPGSYTINAGLSQAAGVYSRVGYGIGDPGAEYITDFNNKADIELAVSVSNVPYYLGLYIEPKTDKDSYEANEEVRIYCELKDGLSGLPVLPSTIAAEVTKPDGSKETVLLREVAPGSYEGIFNNSSLLGTYYLKFQANKKGYCAGSSAELNFTVGGLEILDGSDFSAGKEISSDPERLTSSGTAVTGAVTDGVTRLLLRVPLKESNKITFSLGGTDNSREDGILRSLDGLQEGKSITVTSSATTHGEFAFCVYQAPEDFVRDGYEQDKRISERSISLNIKSDRPPALEFSKELRLLRPPLILVHGLWSSKEMWDSFKVMLKNKISNLQIYTVDYKETNASDLKVNKAVPYNCEGDSITKAKDDFKANKIAMVQADVLGHSMGGVLARIRAGGDRWSGVEKYYQESNFQQGYINKLITLDSPHFGSFLADSVIAFVNSLNPVARNFLLKRARNSNHPLDEGAIEALQTMSPAIIYLNGVPTDSASHSIAGDFVVNVDLSLVPGDIGEFYNMLKKAGFNTSFDIISGASDLVVSAKSQRGGLTPPASSTFNHHHTAATTEEVVNRTVELLNTAQDDSTFKVGFPINYWPEF